MSDITRNAIAQLREQLEQERTRAEAAEAELRELRKLVDAWKAATEEHRKAVDALRDSAGPDGVLLKLSASVHSAAAVVRNALEALRHG